MSAEPYADIHHFNKENQTVLDEEGDPRFGWYYQIMKAVEKPMTDLIGPYSDQHECQMAALQEWSSLAA